MIKREKEVVLRELPPKRVRRPCPAVHGRDDSRYILL
jgi:hypothetical protein